MTTLRRCALALALLLAASGSASAVERILQFISDVTVRRDGDLIVIETIRVQAEGNVIRRGIFRDFPTIYRRADQTRVEVGFRVESVTRNGTTENYALENLSNGVRVRIGSADRTIPYGQHTYVIRYRTTRQIGFFRDYDELYWNVTGTGWVFPIDVAEARINLPEKVPFRQTAIYTGPQGASGKDATIVSQEPGRIVFRTTRPLPPRNGLTVAAAWDKGVVAPPTSSQLASYWLTDNAGPAAAVLGLLLMLGYYAFAWLRVGRDPPAGTVIPLFAPPGGMSPAATRYIDRMSFDNGCFAVAIINAGVKGHLQIVEQGDETTLKKLSGDKPLAPEEQAMMAKLFPGKNSSSLRLVQDNHGMIGRAQDALSRALAKTYFGRLFTNNHGWSSIGLLLLVIIVPLILYVLGSVSPLFGTLVLISVVGLPLIMIGAAMIFVGWQRFDRSKWRLIVGLILFALVVAGAMYLTTVPQTGDIDLALTGSLLAMGTVVGLGFPLLKAPSRSGRKVMDEIQGFREYLSVAEEDRLNLLNPPQKTPELFEKFLPYAVALDCQNAWAAKFAGVLAAAATAATAAATTWYVGNRDWANDPVSFANHLGSDLSRTVASASTPPGSSGGSIGSSSGGSSGGGSSGGGGGGGGGGGW